MVWTSGPVLGPLPGSQPSSAPCPVCAPSLPLPFLPSWSLWRLPSLSFTLFTLLLSLLFPHFSSSVFPPFSLPPSHSESVSVPLSHCPFVSLSCSLPPFLHICQPLILPLSPSFPVSHPPWPIGPSSLPSLAACSAPRLSRPSSSPGLVRLPVTLSVSPSAFREGSCDLRAADRASCGCGRP